MTRHLRNFAFLLVFLRLCPLFLHPQTAETSFPPDSGLIGVAQAIEDILEVSAVTYSQAAWFMLEAVDRQTQAGSFGGDEAFRYAQEQGWLPRNVQAQDEVILRNLAFLIMRAFNLRGGMMYSIFRTPHYAYRELVYRNVLTGRIDPELAVSGDDLLFIINRVVPAVESDFLPVSRRERQQ